MGAASAALALGGAVSQRARVPCKVWLSGFRFGGIRGKRDDVSGSGLVLISVI